MAKAIDVQRSLTILTFLHSFEAGGVERDAFRFAQAARTRNVDVHLLVGSRIGPQFDEFGSTPHEILVQRPFGGRFVSTIQLVALLPGRIRAIDPDVLYCAGNTYTFITVMLKIRLGRRCPPIVVKISNDLQRNDQTALFRYFYHMWVRLQMRFFDVVIAMAAPAVDEIRRISTIPRESIRMIENPSLAAEAIEALAEAASRRRPAAGRRYVAIGRLAPQKNFANLLKAFKLVAAEADRLVIVGDGEQRAELLAMARDLGIAGQLEMPGYKNPVYRFLEAADVFVLSSDYEGLGVVVIEALAAGLPVAATNCCVNMQELLGHGAFGAMAPIRNPEALAAAMARAAAMSFDPARAQMQARRFSVDQTIDRLIGVFSDAAQQNQR